MSSQQATIGTEFAQALGRALSQIQSTTENELKPGQWSENQWQCFHQLGATQLLCSSPHDDETGAGLEDFMVVAARLGEVNAAFAGVESIVAAWILNAIELDSDTTEKLLQNTITIAVADAPDSAPVTQPASVDNVPWGRYAQTVLYIKPEPSAGTKSGAAANESQRPASIVIVDRTNAQQQHETGLSENIAGEARDSIELPSHAASYTTSVPYTHLVALLALGKAAQMVGVMQEVVRLSASFVSQREQFGRPLSRFQAVQHSLASMYAETVTASVATRAALRGGVSDLSLFDASAAIVRTRESATKVAALAHQAHGAMGFTDEYALAGYSRRLWAWRDEYNSERYWQGQLGKMVLQSDQSLLAQLTEASG